VIFVNMRHAIDAAAGPAIVFGLGVSVAVYRRFGDAAMIGVDIVVALSGMLAGTLRFGRRADGHHSEESPCGSQSYGNSETNLHRPASSLNFLRCLTESRELDGHQVSG
jgi:hypothetical protein